MSNARSPREVCSTTMGTRGLIRCVSIATTRARHFGAKAKPERPMLGARLWSRFDGEAESHRSADEPRAVTVATEPDSVATTEAEAPPRRRVLIVIGALMLTLLLAALDQTIVSTALPTIVGDLGGLNHLSWVVTSYLLTATVSIPLWGRASDLVGRKRLFIAAIGVFLTGSALSGAAQSLGELIAARALQGVGAGGLMVGAQAIIADI